jgi:hypothetical protein
MEAVMTDITYPPLDVPKPVAENLWIVDSGPLRAMGVIPLPVRMTVIRLENGELLLHSPTRHTAELQTALEGFGPIRHLVAPNIVHWSFLKDWQTQLPEAVTWAAPGLRNRGSVKKSGVQLDRDMQDGPLPGWPDEIDRITVQGGGGFHEVALFHRPSRALILVDLVQNLEAEKLPVLMRPLARIAGNVGPDGKAPAYLRAVVKLGGAKAHEAGRRLVETRPERVIFAHGRWFDHDGGARLERSLRWLAG